MGAEALLELCAWWWAAFIMRQQVRVRAVPDRHGRGEFVLLRANMSVKAARLVMDRVQRPLAARPLAGLPPRLSSSVGAAGYPVEATEAATLVSVCDKRMSLQQSVRGHRGRTASHPVVG